MDSTVGRHADLSQEQSRYYISYVWRPHPYPIKIQVASAMLPGFLQAPHGVIQTGMIAKAGEADQAEAE